MTCNVVLREITADGQFSSSEADERARGARLDDLAACGLRGFA
jgi:hypothetical protein